MSRHLTIPTLPPAWSYAQELKEISLFFDGKDQVHKTFHRLIKRLEAAGIPYATVGAMALAAHRYRRATTDVDMLLTADGFTEFKKKFVPEHYSRAPRRPRGLVDRTNGVAIEFLVTGLFPGTGKPGPIAYPDPASVRALVDKRPVVNLATLIELKLAARRWRDFADVVELIRHNRLDESFASDLHRSVRNDYIECVEEKRREDTYEAH
jgi:hypothetical protein